MEQDEKGNHFVEVSGVRLTYVSRSSRSSDKDWSEGDVIRIQAYKGPDNKALHPGPEIALESKYTAIELIEAICRLIIDKDA